jgi:outer membrane protein assembly factor BamB
VISSDDWSVAEAFGASDGHVLWRNDKLKNRDLSAPLLLGPSAVFGDYKGFVHFLSRDDGSFVARVPTDGSRISAPPVVAGDTLVVQTKDGNLFGFRPR